MGTLRVHGTPLVAAVVLVLAAPSAARAATITISDAQVTETNASISATFTVTRVTGLLDLAGPASVSFRTVDGSAVAGADYTAVSGGLTFDPPPLGGTRTQDIMITVKGDVLDEPTESFRVLISGSSEISVGEAIGTIVDDDPPPVVAVADAPGAAEGTQASFAVGLSTPSGRDVSVSYATADGTATAPADYSARTGHLTIPAGSTAATVPVALLDDPLDEPNETFELRISAPVLARLGDAAGIGTILDNDGPGSAASPALPPAAVGVPATGSSSSSSSTTPAVQPRLGIARPRLRRPSTVLLTLSCPKSAISCKGRVTLFSRPNRRSKIKALRKQRRLGGMTFRLAGGRVNTLEIALSPTDRRLLQRSGRMGVRAYAIVEDGTGRTSVRTVNGTLIARLAHSGLSRR
ncbi:MAG TPA: Calx-beta domain-containing protein [Solirubrobacteraceae bacterium]